MSRVSLRPTQTPTQWAPEIKTAVCEADHSPPSGAWVNLLQTGLCENLNTHPQKDKGRE